MNELSQQIPISKTPVSQHLREVAAQAVISTRMVEKIFTATDPSSLPDGKIIGKALQRLLKANTRQEAMLRTLTAVIFEQETKRTVQRAICSVTDEIISLLSPLLFHQGLRDAFKHKLERFMKDAASLWNRTMKSTIKIQVDNRGEVGWYDEHDHIGELGVKERPFVPHHDGPIMIMFPRICIHGAKEPVHEGYALWPDQSLFVAGCIEVQNQVSRIRANERQSVVGRRRRSTGLSSVSSHRSLHKLVGSVSDHSAAQIQKHLSKAGQDHTGDSSI